MVSDRVENAAPADVAGDHWLALSEVERDGLATALTAAEFDDMMRLFDEAGDWMQQELRRRSH